MSYTNFAFFRRFRCFGRFFALYLLDLVAVVRLLDFACVLLAFAWFCLILLDFACACLRLLDHLNAQSHA